MSDDAGAQVAIITHINVILMFGTGYMRVLYLGRAPRTDETLPDFGEKCRVTRHSRVFRGLTGSQRTPEFWGVTNTHPKSRTHIKQGTCWSLHGHEPFFFVSFINKLQ